MNVKCPHCGTMTECKRSDIGRTVSCPSCQKSFSVEMPNLCLCPDCAEWISKRAAVCPYCGAPQQLGNAVVTDSGDGRSSCERDVMNLHPAAVNYLGKLILFGILSIIIIGIPFLIKTLMDIYCTSYRITTRRVVVTTGLLTQRQTEIWLQDMRCVNLQQSFWENLVGTGDIAIGTAATAGTEIILVGVKDAQKVIKTINGLR